MICFWVHTRHGVFHSGWNVQAGIPKIASELTLNHLENYNYHQEWKVPVAPEAYSRNLDLFGDQFSNFNAGKILLFIGLAEFLIPYPNKF